MEIVDKSYIELKLKRKICRVVLYYSDTSSEESYSLKVLGIYKKLI